MTRRSLAVDPIGCTGHGLCADLLPELITLDDWGYPILLGRDVPADLLSAARRAVAACPQLALAVVRDAPTSDGRARSPSTELGGARRQGPPSDERPPGP